MDKKTILVAFGGASPEHEVSVLTAHQAISALDESRYRVLPLYITKSGRWLTGEVLVDLKKFENIDSLKKEAVPCTFTKNEYGQTVLQELKTGLFSKNNIYRPDIVLTAFHGSTGENGAFQGVCETYNLPYTGSGVMGSAIGMDKVTAKKLCRTEDIPVVDSVDFYEDYWAENEQKIITSIEKLTYPVIVKPVHLGSSIGVKVARDRDSLVTAIEEAFRYDAHLLVEKVISPLLEINCSVLGTSQNNKTSVCERPLGKEELLSFTDKYMSEEGAKGMASADRKIPADIPDDLSESIQSASQKIFTLLGCSGLARLDFLVDANSNQFYFNEINTIPGSFSFYLWKESDISFSELLDELIEIGFEEHQQKNRRIQTYETNLLSQKAVKGIKGLKNSK